MQQRTAIMGLALGIILAQPAQAWKAGKATLMTRWAADVSPSRALPEYPRPQLVRPQWQSLNGLWDFSIQDRQAARPSAWDSQILVPFPAEAALSGVMRPINETQRLWYRRSFKVPAGWAGQRLWLHFGAVTWKAEVWVNGQALPPHEGGYDGFSYDITDQLKGAGGEEELVVAAWNPADTEAYPHGKQSFKPVSIFYTAASGIWQSVWMEPVPKDGIRSLKLVPDVDKGCLRLTVQAGSGLTVKAVAMDGKAEAGSVSGVAGQELSLPLASPKLWSPASPFLYDLKVIVQSGGHDLDSVGSYFGLRKIALGKDAQGLTRPYLNGDFLFQMGVLDQGYWPDGIYTAPTDEALRFDIEAAKRLGLLVDRKHMKVEPERWYYWCDKLGLMVYQDIPSGQKNGVGEFAPSVGDQARFKRELQAMVDGRGNHPSIVQWTIFNEGWMQDKGQAGAQTKALTRWLKAYDPTRLVDSVSGWTDAGVGDVHDIHSYPAPRGPEPEAARYAAVGEFGGLGYYIPGHTYPNPGSYQTQATQHDFELAYLRLLKKVWEQKAQRGLSSAIYTQLTDVETECNGYFTYDRAILKGDQERLANANRGIIVLPAPTMTPVPPAPVGPLAGNVAGSAAIRVISVNFVGGSGPNGQPQPMSGAEKAGAISAAHWNNAPGAQGSLAGLKNGLGAPTGASVIWASQNTWSTSVREKAGSARMMKGYLDTSESSTTVVRVDRLPDDFVAQGYRVYAYFDGDEPDAERKASYSIDGIERVGTDPAKSSFRGRFAQALEEDGPTDEDCVVFDGLKGKSFTLKAHALDSDGNNRRAPLSGFQVVRN